MNHKQLLTEILKAADIPTFGPDSSPDDLAEANEAVTQIHRLCEDALAKLDNGEQNRDSGNEQSMPKPDIDGAPSLLARIMQDPDGGLLVFIQIDGNEENAWIADGRHLTGMITNPPGVKIAHAEKKTDGPRILTPNGAGHIIKPN